VEKTRREGGRSRESATSIHDYVKGKYGAKFKSKN